MAEARRDATSEKAYRVRCVAFTFRPGSTERHYRNGGWVKGFDTAAQAAEYMRRSIRIGNLEVTATRPGHDGDREWTSIEGLRNIARQEK